MNSISQRAFSRSHYKAPILFSNQSSYEYHKATMVNSSVGGIYFETRLPLKPGDSVFIKMLDMMPDPYWPEACDCYYAEVRWCLEKKKNETVCYGVGVRFITSTCSNCGKQLENHDTDQVDLCPACQSQFCLVSGGRIGCSIENFFMGNVL